MYIYIHLYLYVLPNAKKSLHLDLPSACPPRRHGENFPVPSAGELANIYLHQ